ncbi:ABC transporter permease [Paenibacillus sp. NPDC056722]|uniref:ABC transporter permease n=1 Tax=Paenibacillus sp. NPDC056722 TaxID=3345924 RepID=UPI0036AED69B
MIQLISLEFYKIRRKRLYLMATLFLGVELAGAFMAVSMSLARHPDQEEWMPLLATLSSMNGLFLPILSAVCVSRISDMEHKGNTWKLLLSVSVRRGQLYLAKYICACVILLGVSLLQIAAAAAFGIGKVLWESFPLGLMVQFMAGTLLTNMVIIALQQWLSLAVKNQAFALCLGMLGGFFGMTGDFFPQAVRQYFIWSNYNGLSPVRQSYVDNAIQFTAIDGGALLPQASILVVLGVVIYIAGSRHISRQDI